MKKLSLFFVIALVCCCGAQATVFTVDQGGGGTHTTIQAAVNAAAGDAAVPHTINIVDGATYVEDVFVGNNPGSTLVSGAPSAGGEVASPFLDGLTLAAVPGPATIAAIGARGGVGTLGAIFTAAGAPGAPDSHGLIIEADGVTVNDLVLTGVGQPLEVVAGSSSACAITADNTTFNNCTIISDDGGGDEVGLLTIAGDWPALDATITGGLLASVGYVLGDPCNGLVCNNCTLTASDPGPGARSSIGLASVDFAVGFAVLAAGGAVYFTPLDGTGWAFTDCLFTGTDDTGQCANAAGPVFSNCIWEDNDDSFQIEGGSGWVFDNCLFQASAGNELLHLSADVGLGGKASDATVNDSVFCGGTNATGLIEIDEGSLTLNGSIITMDAGLGAGPVAISFDPADYDSDIAALLAAAPVPGPGYPARADLVIDQSDIIMNDSTGAGVLVRPDSSTLDPGEPVAGVSITNSIISSGAASSVSITGAGSVPGSTKIVEYNDLFTSGTGVDDAGTLLAGVPANNLNEDPGYLDALSCPTPGAADFYRYSNANLADAGDSGQPIGSQGPTVIPADVKEWNLYK